MATPRPPLPQPARVLIVAEHPGSARAGMLETAFRQPGVDTLVVAPGPDLPPPSSFGAIVLDGTASGAPAAFVDDLRQAVTGGASLVVIAPQGGFDGNGLIELAGARTTSSHPLGEWFLKVGAPEDLLVERVPDEFPVTGSLQCLEPTGDATSLLKVSIDFTDRAVVVTRMLGAGRVVVSGIGGIVNPELLTIFRRAIGPAAGATATATRASRPMGFAVLGYGPFGGMGLYHGLAAAATRGLEMIAACDSDPARRKAAEQEFPGLRPYESSAELAADDDVDVVVIATPPSTHAALALELLRAGKHVALEKPMCLTVAEADELVALAETSQLALTVHQSRRWDPDFLAVRRAVESGMLGEVFNVETFVGGFEHPCRAWHSERAISGGAVYDWGSHHLDWILQLMPGFPDRLVAHGHKRVWRDITNLDQVRVRLSWPDGREAEFMQSDVAGIRRPKFFVQGTAGTLAGHYRPLRFERVEPGIGYVGHEAHHAEAPVDLTVARYEGGYGLTETRLPPAPADRYGFHRNLADHLRLGEPLAVTPSSARRVVALLEAAQRSTDDGNTPVDLTSPDK